MDEDARMFLTFQTKWILLERLDCISHMPLEV